MTSKLTLSVDSSVVEAAKRYAAASGTSVSRLVENYLAAITRPPPGGGPPPVLARWRGSMADVDVEDYRAHAVGKYGK